MKINAFSYIQIQDLNIENKKWMHHFLKPNRMFSDWQWRLGTKNRLERAKVRLFFIFFFHFVCFLHKDCIELYWVVIACNNVILLGTNTMVFEKN